jgi:DNA-binding NarL/FixJ family response regulator
MPMKSISVLLAEDHQIVREGLRAMLNLEPDIKSSAKPKMAGRPWTSSPS